MEYKKFALKAGLGILTFTGILTLLSIMQTCESGLEQKIKKEIEVNTPKVLATNYQTSFNYFNYNKK